MNVSPGVRASQCVGVSEWVLNRVKHDDALPTANRRLNDRAYATIRVVVPVGTLVGAGQGDRLVEAVRLRGGDRRAAEGCRSSGGAAAGGGAHAGPVPAA